MKIAICYSGNLRTYEYCVLNHSQLLNEADIYISTWDDFVFSDVMNDTSEFRKINIKVPDKVSEDYIVNKTPNNFNIKSIKIDRYKDIHLKTIKINPLYNIDRINGLAYQYFKIKDCYELLLKTNNNYDFVVRLRPDITLERLSFDKDRLIFDNNIWYNNTYSFDKSAINEMVWISNMELMYKACKIYDNIESINQILTPEMVYGESFCFKNLLIEKIIDKVRTDFLNYQVIR